MRGTGLVAAAIIASQAAPSLAQGNVGAPFRNTIAACEAIADPSQRLACFDAAARQLRSLPDTALRTPEDPVARERRRRSLFGLFGREREDEERRQRPDEPPPMKEVTAEVLARAEGSPGSWLIVLRDAGSWRTETRMGFEPPKVGSSVKIRRGAMGGYLLDVNRQESIRVTRLN